MKSTELFDLLGEIDDKFFVEARIPEEQHGVEVVSEHRPIRGFLGIFLPIAACVAIIAAVAVGANILSKNAGFIGPNDPDSELSSDAPFTSDNTASSESSSTTSTSSVPDVSNDIERLTEAELLENYPPIDLDSVPDIKGSGLEVQVTQQDKTLQKATLGTFEYRKYTLYMLGEYIHIDKSNDPDCLYAYNVTLAVVKDGKVIGTDGTHTTSVSMGQGGYRFSVDELKIMAEGKISYLQYSDLCESNIVIFRYILPKDGSYERDYECTFYTITDSDELRLLMGDTSAIGGSGLTASVFLYDGFILDTGQDTITDKDVRYKFISKNFGSNPYDGAPHFTASEYVDPDKVLDLSEYPPVDISKIPDVGEKVYNSGLDLPNATIAEKQVGEYTITIIGDGLRTSPLFQNHPLIQKTGNMIIMAENARVVISRDGKILKVTHENGAGDTDIYFDAGEDVFASYLFPDVYEMKDGIVFGLNRRTANGGDFVPRFGTIVDDAMKQFKPSATSYDGRVDPFEDLTLPVEEVTLLADENTLIIDGIKCIFDFDTLTFSDAVTPDVNIGDYTAFDGDSLYTVQPHVILDTKQSSEYKFYLLGDNVEKKAAEEFPLVDFDKLYIVAEKDGKKIAQITADNYNLNGSKLTEYLQPFEMKDGRGFVMYYALDPYGADYQYAMIYKLENDTITKLRYEYDYGPAPATGSPHFVGKDFTIDHDNNAIIVGDHKLTLDFDQNVFSETAREI